MGETNETYDLMLEGFICQTCGEFLGGDSPGYPRSCGDCESDEADTAQNEEDSHLGGER